MINLLAFLVFGGMLAWGLKTGKMPGNFYDVDGLQAPAIYWGIAAIYAVIAVGSLFRLLS